MKTTLASIGTRALGIAILLALALIPVLLLQGGVWLSALLFPWLAAINALALLVTLFVLLPNAVFSSTPKFAGSGMMIVSLTCLARPFGCGACCSPIRCGEDFGCSSVFSWRASVLDLSRCLRQSSKGCGMELA